MAGDAKTTADAVHEVLTRYRGSAWRFDRDNDQPHDQRNVLAHRVLRLNCGAVPAARSLRRLFSAVAKTPDALATIPGET
ncbi:MAG: hypothetical protein ACXWIW_10235 [Croceibacterium sp.]